MAVKVWAEGTSGTPQGNYADSLNWVGNAAPYPGDSALFEGSYRKLVSVRETVVVGSWGVNSLGYTFSVANDVSLIFLSGGIGGEYQATILANGIVNFLGSSSAGSNNKYTGSGVVSFSNTANASNALFQMPGGEVFFENASSAKRAAIILTGADSLVEFRGSSTADGSGVSVEGVIRFKGSSTADEARLATADIEFRDQSTAADSSIRYFKSLSFHNSSSAANATIQFTSTAPISFHDASTAGSALIFSDSAVSFFDSALAADAQISAGSVTFDDQSSAGNAAIKATTIVFNDNATAGNARLTISQTADFSATAGRNGDHRISADSFNGAGNLLLGSNELTLGAAGGSSSIQGTISGGGSLIKTGTGRLQLSGTADQTGGTRVDGGIVQLDGVAHGDITVSSGGRVAGSGQIAGTLTALAGSAIGPGLADAGQEGFGTLSVSGNVETKAGSTFSVQLGGPSGTERDVLAVDGGITVEGTNLSVALSAFTPSLTASQSWLVIDNDGTEAIEGKFAGLWQGDTLVLGNRLFSISYTGGSGNDVVLTSEGVLIIGANGRETVSATKTPVGQPFATVLADKIIGLGGNDKLRGDGGSDTIQGGTGNDDIDGGKGKDTADYSDKTKSASVKLDGSHEVRIKIDGKAEDALKNIENVTGGSAADKLTGDKQDNRFDGGLGKDILKGSGGKDTFVFSVAAGKANADTVLDFKHKTDSIALDDRVFAGIGVELDKAEFFAKKGATKAHDADDRIIYNKTTGQLFYDADGSDGPAKALLFATLSNKAALTITDFDIV